MNNFIEKIKKVHMPFMSSLSVFFDLGTSMTRIAIKDKGIIIKEPSYLGLNKKTKEYIFFGSEAKTILGKTPDFISIVTPLVNGILSDFDAEVALIDFLIKKGVGPYISKHTFLKPVIKAFTAVPHISTEIERKAVEEALEKAGCAKVYIVEKSMATAAGCGYNVFSHHPQIIVDLGGGLIEISIISGGGIVVQKSLKYGGEHMNKLIANYTYLKHGIVLGEKTCEELKIKLLKFDKDEETQIVRGKSLETGLPKSVHIRTADIKEALITSFNQVIDSIKELIEISPPEIADEVFKNGITLTGAMAAVRGIGSFFNQELKIPVHISEHHAEATIYGLMSLEKNPELLRKLIGEYY